ncbi:hypothetical protein H8K32_19645 [Undibacterium jejuense]|uniref:Uncharacterized protein n=1 Tax=Undibacterium jejuense TaxID=1344949 RepID=A0A923HNP7_9BURK|nr:hypothetical protein [Undibacterium jejuense]MBC3864319.1 hypothetical protein [Undibacterium jejuense]
MKLAKILTIGCILCGLNAQAEGTKSPVAMTLDTTINQAANSLEEQFEANYGGRIEEVRLLSPTLSLHDWKYQDTRTKKGFVIGSADDAKLKEHIQHLKVSVGVPDVFAPFNAKMAKAIQGTDADRNDLMLRLVALQILREVSNPENNWSEYQQINISNSQLQHYARLTRNIEFANLLSIEIAHKLNSTYKNQMDFMKDFVAAFVEIPKDRLTKIASEANKTVAAQLQEGLTVKISSDDAESWSFGNSHYQVKEDGSSTLLKDKVPVYGGGYIGGKYYALKIDTLVVLK